MFCSMYQHRVRWSSWNFHKLPIIKALSTTECRSVPFWKAWWKLQRSAPQNQHTRWKKNGTHKENSLPTIILKGKFSYRESKGSNYQTKWWSYVIFDTKIADSQNDDYEQLLCYEAMGSRDPGIPKAGHHWKEHETFLPGRAAKKFFVSKTVRLIIIIYIYIYNLSFWRGCVCKKHLFCLLTFQNLRLKSMRFCPEKNARLLEEPLTSELVLTSGCPNNASPRSSVPALGRFALPYLKRGVWLLVLGMGFLLRYTSICSAAKFSSEIYILYMSYIHDVWIKNICTWRLHI